MWKLKSNQVTFYEKQAAMSKRLTSVSEFSLWSRRRLSCVVPAGSCPPCRVSSPPVLRSVFALRAKAE